MTPRPTPRATVEPLTLHADPRGILLEPLGADALPAQRNSHLVVTAPGAVRGNHRHELGTETIVVLGPGLVRLREGDATRDVEVPAGEGYRFVIPPGVAHAFQNTGAAPMVLVSFSTRAFDPAAADVVREVLIPPPPGA